MLERSSSKNRAGSGYPQHDSGDHVSRLCGTNTRNWQTGFSCVRRERTLVRLFASTSVFSLISRRHRGTSPHPRLTRSPSQQVMSSDAVQNVIKRQFGIIGSSGLQPSQLTISASAWRRVWRRRGRRFVFVAGSNESVLVLAAVGRDVAA